MTSLKQRIHNKTYNTYPTYGTIQDIKNSPIDRVNIFPYPFYFQSNPYSDYATVYNRVAGWSPEVIVQRVVTP